MSVGFASHSFLCAPNDVRLSGLRAHRRRMIMKKKVVSVLLASAMVLGLAACGKVEEAPAAATEAVEEATETVEEAAEEVTEEVAEAVEDAAEEVADAVSGDVMSYADYMAADVDSEVTVETYVQAKQGWWEDKATLYTQSKEGAYFIYDMPISEEEYDKLVPGTKIKVTGYKSEWSGEIEIVDATYEIVEGDTFVAEATDVTDKLDSLEDYMNQLVAFKDMTVKAVSYKNEQPGDDIYVTLTKDDKDYEFCLEYYLNGSDEELYNLVGGLEEGQTVDVEGFLYWYEGPDAHITSVTVK